MRDGVVRTRLRALPEVGDRVLDPAGASYRVLALHRNRLLIEDTLGDRWVLGLRRILAGTWRAGRNR